MLFGNTSSRIISNLVLYPRSGFGGKIFVLGLIRFNQESVDSRFLHCATSTLWHRLSQRGSRRAWSSTGTMRSSHPPTGTKTPAPRLWASPRPLMGHNERPGIGLVSIRQINSPYHTNLSKSIPSSSVDNQIPLAGKVVLATVTCRGKGKTMCRCVRTHTHAPLQILRL